MSWKSESFTWSIQVLSPLHIRGDEEVDPLSYVVLERENAIGLFDSLSFAETIPEESRLELLGLLRGYRPEQLPEVVKFLKKHLVPATITEKVAAASGFVEELCQILGIRSSGAAVNLQAEMIARLKAQMSGATPARGGRSGSLFGGGGSGGAPTGRNDGGGRGQRASRDDRYPSREKHSRHGRDSGRRDVGRSETSRSSIFDLGFARVMRGPKGPYIPGSSIKGAIRSAVMGAAISHLDSSGLLPPTVSHSNSPRAIEKVLFRGLSQDPFRFLSVGDFELEDEGGTEVRFALSSGSRHHGRKGQDRRAERGTHSRRRDSNNNYGNDTVGYSFSPGFSRLVEVVVPGTRFRGRITVSKVDRAELPGGFPHARLQEVFDFEHSSLVSALNDFFIPIKERELKRFENLNLKPIVRTSDGEALLRLGHFVGTESKQLPIFRRSLETAPLITACNDRDGKGDLSPFGWVSVEMM